MKTFIFLLILVIAFFGYLFFGTTPHDTVAPIQMQSYKTIEKQTIPTLEDIENPAVNRKPIPKLTVENLQEFAALSNINQTPISEQMTFDMLKNIILQIHPNHHTSFVTLNTSMRSLLRTDTEKQMFKQKVEGAFNLTREQIGENMQKNRLLWDWVNFLQE